jgi:hypothetical protein
MSHVKRIATSLALVAGIQWPTTARPQTAAVAITKEPHHHLSYTDANVRLFRVLVPAHTSTLLHRHDADYIWLALGESEFVNAVAGKPEALVTAADASIHFTRGAFAHVARNERDSAFRNVTIELLRPQTNPRNLCDQVLAGQPLDCPTATSSDEAEFAGASVRPGFQTDQTRVAILALEPNATMTILASKTPPLLIALRGTEARSTISARAGGRNARTASRTTRAGDVRTGPASVAWTIRNVGRSTARFAALSFTSAAP